MIKREDVVSLLPILSSFDGFKFYKLGLVLGEFQSEHGINTENTGRSNFIGAISTVRKSLPLMNCMSARNLSSNTWTVSVSFR